MSVVCLLSSWKMLQSEANDGTVRSSAEYVCIFCFITFVRISAIRRTTEEILD